MTKRRTKKAYRRTKKYKKKLITRIINLIFKENVQFYSVDLRDYLRLDNLLERETLNLLEKNVKLGLIKPEEKDLYLAFWREIRQLGQRFSDKTLENRIEEKLNEFITRGLKEEKLEEIIDLVKDQLPRKKIFEQTLEWSTLIDYLKFKVFAKINPITEKMFDISVFSTLSFFYKISPIPTRLFSVSSIVTEQLVYSIKRIIRKMIELNLTPIVKAELIYSWSIPPYFRKFLEVKPRLHFFYELSYPYFERFELSFYSNTQYSYNISPVTTTILSVSSFANISYSYSISLIPIRKFTLRAIASKQLIYYYKPVVRQSNELSSYAKRELIYSIKGLVRSLNELKANVSCTFSYEIKPSS